MTFHVIEAGKSRKADEVNFIVAGVEIVDGVVADRLREDEQIVAPAPVSVSSPDQAKIGAPLCKNLHIVGHGGAAAAAVGIGPGFRHIEHQRARIARRAR